MYPNAKKTVPRGSLIGISHGRRSTIKVPNSAFHTVSEVEFSEVHGSKLSHSAPPARRWAPESCFWSSASFLMLQML